MFQLKKGKTMANIVIDDYAIRFVENRGSDLTNLVSLIEEPLPVGLVEHGKIIDEVNLFQFIKQFVSDLKIKNRRLRFYVPNALVIMRKVDYPSELADDEIKEYFQMEIGKSIHLPFEHPLIDVFPHSEDIENEERKKATLFAAPEDEILKYTELFIDASLKPVAIDVQALGNYRYFYHLDLYQKGNVYLFYEVNLTSTTTSIFYNHQLEFLGYQDLDVEVSDWNAEMGEDDHIHWTYKHGESSMEGTLQTEVTELERMLNFYRYSIHHGNRQVSQVILLGDHPQLNYVAKKIEDQYNLPLTILQSTVHNTDVAPAYVPVLGLALKGGV